ncbi:MAG: hypothetical protein ACI4EE_07780 [Lachnospiraceae bacterium]
MKMMKKIGALVLMLVILVTSGNGVAHAATMVGDIVTSPILLEQKQTKNTKFSAGSNIKYFRVSVKEAGVLTMSYTSTSLKKPVTITLNYDDNAKYYDTKTIKYNKSKKQTKGSMTTSCVLLPGTYNITVKTAESLAKSAKFTFATTFKASKLSDIEPNNNEDQAQAIKLETSKKATSYKMYLSGMDYGADMIDYMKFSLKKDQKVKIQASSTNAATVRVLIKQKTANGYEVVNKSENDQYFEKNGSKYEFTYTEELKKGDYVIMFWMQEGQNQQFVYSVKGVV